MLVSAPPSALLFAVAVVCGVASVWFKVRTVPLKEFRLLTCGVGMWVSARDLEIPTDVFLIATLSLTRNRSLWFNWALTLMGLGQWLWLFSETSPTSEVDVYPRYLLIFVYVASATSIHQSCFRACLAALRSWVPRNCVFVAAVFVWTGYGGVFSRLGSALLVALLGEYAPLVFAIAGVIAYISSLSFVNNILINGGRTICSCSWWCSWAQSPRRF